jgi:hypothetical protein
MPSNATLAAVFAAYSIFGLLAKGQDQPLIYKYPGDKEWRTAGATPEPSAQKLATPAKIPEVLHFCAAHCLTFKLEKDGKLHNYTNLPGQQNEHRILTIDKFTAESVIIRRADTGTSPMTAVYTGQMEYGNNSLHGSGWSIAWGSALSQLPGSDEERAQRDGTPMPSQPQLNSWGIIAGLLVNSFGGGSGGGGDLPTRINRLQSQLADARNHCNFASGSTRLGLDQSSCGTQADLENQLSDLRAELITEIQELQEAHNKLAQQCSGGDKDACDRQQKVDAQLARDRQAQVGSLFQ